jgi:hypothetical protein
LAQALLLLKDASQEYVLEKVLTQAAFSPQVDEALRLGPAHLVLPTHTTFDERLFPVEAVQLKYACRLLAVLADSPKARVLPQFAKLRTWFLLCSSPFNQVAHVHGMDCLGVRALRSQLEGEEEEVLATHIAPEDVCFHIEQAGLPEVNGVYTLKPPLVATNPRWYCEANALSLYKCALASGGEEWFVSKLLLGVSHSDSSTVDYYSCTAGSLCVVPHPAEWTIRARYGGYPGPMVRKVVLRSLLAGGYGSSSSGEDVPITNNNWEGEEEEDRMSISSLTNNAEEDDSLYDDLE